MKVSERIKTPRIVGWRECVALPELGISELKVKIDTGARTSALHAHITEVREVDAKMLIEFDLLNMLGKPVTHHVFPVSEVRMIKNTSGIAEQRYVIRTVMKLGTKRWKIDVALSDRAEMKHDMILGRRAVRGRNIVVDPGRSFLQTKPRI
jgi:hypothetical protein